MRFATRCTRRRFGAVGLLVLALLAAPGALAAGGRTLVLGKVTEVPARHVPRLAAMVEYLTERLGAKGVVGGEVRIAASNAEMVAHLKAGTVDLVSETGFSAMRFVEGAGAEILLREFKGGVGTYRSLIVAHRDGPVLSLADLNGRRIAFEDRGSTSAYLMPLALLRGRGLSVVELATPEAAVPASAVGYAFAGAEINIAAWIIKGLADAGALSDLELDDPEKIPRSLRERLRVVHTGPSMARSLLLARAGLESDLKAAVTEILLGMHADAKGREVLRTYYRTARFEGLDQRTRDDLVEVRRLAAWLAEEVR